MTYIPSPTRYDTMAYRRCGKSGLLLPALSLGLWHNFGSITPFETQQAILRTAFDNGITHFDLANNYGPPYGEAERNFGVHMLRDWKPHRDELVISTGAMNERQVEEYYQKTSAGITETAASSHEDPVQVYPTRFTDQLQLRFKNTESRRTNIVLYNNAGTTVFEREYNTQGLPRLVISGLEALPKGSYTLTISQDGKPLPAKKLFKW